MGSCSTLCGTWTLLAQCIATLVQLHSDFGSLCLQNSTVDCLFYCDKRVGEQRRLGGLRHTEMLCGVRCLVYKIAVGRTYLG